MKDIVLHVRVNSDIKLEAEEILSSLGLNMSTAVNMFLKRVCINHGLPFELRYDDYNETTKKAIEESYSIADSSIKYESVNDLFKDAEKWKD